MKEKKDKKKKKKDKSTTPGEAISMITEQSSDPQYYLDLLREISGKISSRSNRIQKLNKKIRKQYKSLNGELAWLEVHEQDIAQATKRLHELQSQPDEVNEEAVSTE